MKKDRLMSVISVLIATVMVFAGVCGMLFVKSLLPDYKNSISENLSSKSAGMPVDDEELEIRKMYPWNRFDSSVAEKRELDQGSDFWWINRHAASIGASFMKEIFQGADMLFAEIYYCNGYWFVFDCPIEGVYGNEFCKLAFVTDEEKNLLAFDFYSPDVDFYSPDVINTGDSEKANYVYNLMEYKKERELISVYDYEYIADITNSLEPMEKTKPVPPYYAEELEFFSESDDPTVGFMADYCNFIHYSMDDAEKSIDIMGNILSNGSGSTVYSNGVVYLVYNYEDIDLRIIWDLRFDCISGMNMSYRDN